MGAESAKPLLVVRILVYNHAPFLRDCLNGIVMQETTFPFIAVVHDDASTDGSADIIREYEEKYPHIIKPIYEKENQYSKRDGSLTRVMNAACRQYGPKYHALCEGDDYWTDPRKLQKQVSYLESHPECTLVCSHGVVNCKGQNYVTQEDYRDLHFPFPGTEERDIDIAELTGDGRFLLTASLVYRSELRDSYPPEFFCLGFGDTTLKLMAAMNGTVHFLPDSMMVYRYFSSNWSVAVRVSSKKVESFADIPWKGVITLFEVADTYSEGRYTAIFRNAIYSKITAYLRKYPSLKKDIVAHYRDKLLYPYLGTLPQNRKKGLRFALRRLLYRPYFPSWRVWSLLPAPVRFFYTERENGFSWGVGRLHLLSVEREKHATHLFLLGCRVFTRGGKCC